MDVDIISTNGHLSNGHLDSTPIPVPNPSSPNNYSINSIPAHLETTPIQEETAVDYTDELPTITEGLIPLSLVVERVIGQAHSELANLAEILPSKSDEERKRAIVDYVLQTRRQILKLLVLVRWSKEADNVAKCMNIVGFLARQNYEFDHTIQSLTEVKTMLAGARVRNSDLPTAITVLTTGDYSGLPTCIDDAFSRSEPLADEIVLKTLEEMNDVLRYRLALLEKLPRKMRAYRIADGRVTFKMEGMWEADMTYGGDNEDINAQWYLLSIKFLFRVMDSQGVWSSIPVGPMKENITELCNRELAKRVITPPDDGTAEIEPLPSNQVDVPLIRGFNFLQNLSLCYQIEALYLQAVQLANTSWSGNLRVELSKNRKTLKLEYWIESRTAPISASNSSVPNRVSPVVSPYSAIIISFERSDPAVRSSPSITRAQALEAALSGSEDGSNELEQIEEKLSLTWSTEEVREDARSETKLELSVDLSLESLLLKATEVHAREVVNQLYESLIAEGSGLDEEDLTLVTSHSSSSVDLNESSNTFIFVQLHNHQSVRAGIDQYSGRLNYKSVGEVSAIRETRLRTAADKANENRKMTAESLLRIRAVMIIDEVESRAVYLSLIATRRLSLRDLSMFGSAIVRGYLFIHLSKHQMPMHYLVLLMLEDGFKFALMEVVNESDANQSWLKSLEIGWLDKDELGRWKLNEENSDVAFSFDVSLVELRDIYQFSVNRIASFKIEQQLHIRNIPFKTIPASPNATDPLANAASYLVVHSRDLLRSEAKIAHPNIAIRSFLQNDSIRILFHVRFFDLDLLVPTASQLSKNMTYHSKSSSITFASDDIDQCITTFLSAYAIMARAIVVARHQKGVEKMKKEVKIESTKIEMII